MWAKSCSHYLVDLHDVLPLVVEPRLLLQSVGKPVGHGAQHRQRRLQVAAQQRDRGGAPLVAGQVGQPGGNHVLCSKGQRRDSMGSLMFLRNS